MPRYFFNVIDGVSAPDANGVLLPDIDKAKTAAVVLSGELIRDMGLKFWDAPEWKLEVTDDRGLVFLRLRFSAEMALPEERH